MPSISVIVPVYKVEAFLERCVDSILNQSFADFQLILVDDGSPDNSGAICDRYAAEDSRVAVIHQENGGLSAARNAGIDLALAQSDSQWLTFIDSDDWVEPEFLQYLYTAAVEGGCGISTCGYYQTQGERIPHAGELQYGVLTSDEYFCGDRVDPGERVIACAKLYRKELFAQLRYPVGKLHEDEFTTYKAVYDAGKVAVVSAQLYAYYQNAQGIMYSRWTERKLASVEAAEEQLAYARERGLEQLEKKAAREYIYRLYEQLGYLKTWDGEAKGSLTGMLRKKLRRALRQGKRFGHLPFTWANLWVYEEAYPMKPLWWLVGRAGRMMGK